MGMEYLMRSADPSSGSTQTSLLCTHISFIQRTGNIETVSDKIIFLWHPKEATEKMKTLQGLSAETMAETCQSTESKDGAIRCPIPCKSSRWYREQDFRAAQDLSDFIVSKASPPYFMGSPPVRATNPLVHDTQFCAWMVQSVDKSLGVPIPTKGYNAHYGVREGSVTKA